MGFDQTGFPGDMVENARHGAILLAIIQGKHTACSPGKDLCFVLSVCESNG